MADNGFVRGLASSLDLSGVGRQIANSILLEKEKKKQEEEKKRQAQIMQNVLGKLQAGGEYQLGEKTDYGASTSIPDTSQPLTVGNMMFNKAASLSNPYPTKIEPRTTLTSQFEPYTPEQKTNLFMGLDNQTRDDYQKAQKLFNPEPEYTQFLETNKNIAYNKTANRWEDVRTGEQADPTQYKKLEEPKYFKNRPYGYRKDGTGQLIEDKTLSNPEYIPTPKIGFKDKREYDPTLGKYKLYTETYENGKLVKRSQPSYVEPTERKNGISYMSKDMKKVFDKYEEDRRKLEAQKGMVYQVGTKDPSGDYLVETDKKVLSATDLAKEIAQNRAEHISFIKQAAPPKFNEWYGKVYNHYKGDPEKINEFTQEFLDAFRNGYFKKTVKIKNKKTGATKIVSDPGAQEFNYFREMARALYGGYPETNELQDPSNEDVEIIEEQ